MYNVTKSKALTRTRFLGPENGSSLAMKVVLVLLLLRGVVVIRFATC